MAQSGLDAVFDCLMDGTATITSKAGWKWDDIIYDLGMRLSDIAHQDFIVRGETLDDIRRAKENGQIAFIASLEAATAIENEVDRLDILYGLGIRSSGIAYSEANTLGSGLKEARDGGLTEFGRQAVRRMNKLGIAIDISHSGDQTSLDTIEVSDKPIFITHAGARGLWDTKRMKPDVVLKAMAAKGGVIGIEAAPHTTLTKKHPKHSIESFMEHFEYCVGSRRHRPRRVRAGHAVRRSRRAPPLLRQAAVDQVRARRAGVRRGRVRRRHREPGGGVPEHRALAREARLLGWRHRQGHRRAT